MIAIALLLAQALPVLSVGSVSIVVTQTGWTGSGTGTTTVVHDGTGGLAELRYETSAPGGGASGTWTFRRTASSSGTVPLAWSLTGFHAWFQVRVSLQAFVTPTDGAPAYTTLVDDGPVNCCTSPSGGFSYSGSTSLDVQQGDEFGFRITGSNFDSNSVLNGALRVGLDVVGNGSFEQPVTELPHFDTDTAPSTAITGWNVAAGSVDHIKGYWPAADGAQSVDLDGNGPGILSQTVNTVAGQPYRVAFQYATNKDATTARTMDVTADGSVIGSYTHPRAQTSPSLDMAWQAGSATFVASEGSTLLSFVSTGALESATGITIDAVSVVPDLTAGAPAGDFSFGTPSAGSNDGDPLVVAPGASAQSTVPVALSNGATSVAVAVTGITPGEGGVTATTAGTATTASIVTVTAASNATPGNYVLTLAGAVGAVTRTTTIYVTVPPTAVVVGEPFLTNAYSAPGGSTTLYAGRITADPNTSYTITLASASTCPGGVFPSEGYTDIGSISITTDASGNAFFDPRTPANETPNVIQGAPGEGQPFIAAHVTGPAGRTSGFSPCVVNSPDNDTWPRALDITPAGGTSIQAPSGTWIDQPGTARWFKVRVVPGGSVTLDLSNLPADYDVYLFKDIAQTYEALTAEQDLTKLSAEFAGSGFSGSGFSGSGFSGSGFSGSGFSGSGFSGSGFSGSGFSPDSYSGSGFSGSGFSGSGFSGSGFSGSGFSGSGFSGSGFSGSGFSGSGFSAESFSAAQVYSLLAWSNNIGTANEHAGANTWTSTGDFYIRVNGKNGVSSLAQPFTLNVTVNSSLCSTVNPIGSRPDPIANTYDTIILTDTSRFGGSDTSGMLAALGGLASATNGVVVDLAVPGRVHDLQAQADANTGCVYAKNLVASAARDVVNAYRRGNTSGGVKYVVLAGSDNVLPFFRYPDTSSIGPEVNFFPPVLGDSASEASLRSNYVLGQDGYGSSRSLSLGPVDFPIPELPVGRLVETPAEIAGMVQAYLDQNSITPRTSLVTGYDFIADAAQVGIKPNLDAGTGETGGGRTLIDAYGISPEFGWTATALKSALLGRRNDITFLGGHFSANSALAADFTTVMTTDDVRAADPANLRNTIIFSIGCHSGYNIVDDQGIPNVTRTLDWAQVFAQRQVTSILGTGYQYGDTDFIEYSERIYGEFSRQLLYGTGAVGIGDALVRSKIEYLRQTPSIGDLHEKALLEAALYGLPMMGVNMPAGRLTAPSDGASVPLTPVTSDPGVTTGLRYHDLDQATPSEPRTKVLNVQGGGTLPATFFTAPGGRALTTPGAPVLPLYSSAATAGTNGFVLRGIGFTGGDYADSTVTPLTGAPAIELQSAHTSFNSPTFYPTQMWTANYFGALAGGGGTTLFTTPAQHRAPAPGSDSVTLRLYSRLNLRLFYSSSTAPGSKSAAPVIYGITSDLTGTDTRITAHVVGDPKADVQQVWVTYTEPGSGRWRSFDLGRDTGDPTLWKGTRALAAGTQFIVQAVNGFGLVSQNSNSGAYYQAGVAATTPASASISLGGAASGTYGDSAQVTATLSSGGSPVAAKLVVLTLGSVTRSGTTNASGQVSVTIPLSGGAAVYPLTASFLGDSTYGPASGSVPFTIAKASSTTTVTCPASAAYTGSAVTPCTAEVTGVGGLTQRLAVTYAANTAAGTATATAQFFGDAAHLGSSGQTTFKILWPFTGFFAPVDSAPTLNIATAGSAIPVKFSLGGNRGLAIFQLGYPKYVPISCSTTAPSDPIESTVTANSSGLQYDATSDRYTYVWKTPKTLAGKCYQLQLGLIDGNTLPVANFKFK